MPILLYCNILRHRWLLLRVWILERGCRIQRADGDVELEYRKGMKLPFSLGLKLDVGVVVHEKEIKLYRYSLYYLY